MCIIAHKSGNHTEVDFGIGEYLIEVVRDETAVIIWSHEDKLNYILVLTFYLDITLQKCILIEKYIYIIIYLMVRKSAWII